MGELVLSPHKTQVMREELSLVYATDRFVLDDI